MTERGKIFLQLEICYVDRIVNVNHQLKYAVFIEVWPTF